MRASTCCSSRSFWSSGGDVQIDDFGPAPQTSHPLLDAGLTADLRAGGDDLRADLVERRPAAVSRRHLRMVLIEALDIGLAQRGHGEPLLEIRADSQVLA